MKRNKVSVAQYIEQLIAMSPKPQKEIAQELGYDKPNMITMIKQGKTKLPLNKVGPLARSLGVDPTHLLRITLEEYMPETLEALESVLGKSLVSDDELELVKTVRAATKGIELDFNNEELRHAVADAVRPFADKEYAGREKAADSLRRTAKLES